MNNKVKRICMSVFGVIVCGFSVGIFKMAALGVDPFQSFMSGLNEIITIDFGLLYTIVNALLLLFSFFTDRHYIGIATFVNLFLLGYAVDFSYNLLFNIFGELDFVFQLVFLIVAIILICFASSFYIVADLGVSAYDAISLILSNRYKLIQFKYCRIISDLISVGLGALFLFITGTSFSAITAIIGIGTIITAFFMGPLIDFFVNRVAKPFLNS